MIISPNPSPHTAQLTSTATLDRADPIWCHVKTEWDHQFVKRANFIPWLRAQLQADPIDETASSPEPLLNYVKRRLALAQNQRNPTGNVQSSPAHHPTTTSLVQGPSSATGIVNDTYLGCNQPSSFTPHDSYSGGAADHVSSMSPRPSDRSGTSCGSQLYDHGPLNSSCATSNTQLITRVHAPSTSYSEPSPAPSATTFSSQLGAIADAHMGNSGHMVQASALTSNAQVNGYHCVSNDSTASQQFLASNASPHPYQNPQQIQFLQDQALGNGLQQQQMQALSFSPQSSIQLSSYPSSYIHHPAQSNPALAYVAAHSHPLQPQNVNQYSGTAQSVKVSSYDQLVETHQKLPQHQQNTFTCTNQNLDFPGSALIGNSASWNSAPVVQIDPALFTSYQPNQNLDPQTGNEVLSTPSAIDTASQLNTSSSADNLSPRRTRSAAALLKKSSATPAAPSKPTAAKKALVSKLSGATTASSGKPINGTKSLNPKLNRTADAPTSSTEDSPHQTSDNPAANHSPSNIVPIRKTNLDSLANRNPAAVDQYNRKIWQSRLANVRAELDHISKAPSRSAVKLVKILSMFSISPTPTSGDWSTVPLDGRIEVLSAIRTNASQDFYDTWAHESKGLEMLEAWLKGAVQAQEKAKTKETTGVNAADSETLQRETLLINILKTLAKLSLTVENLQNHAFAKLVLRINKEQNSNKFSADVKQFSNVLEQKWRVMARVAKTGSGDHAANSTSAFGDTKKRQESASETNLSKKRKIEPIRIPVVPTPPSSKNTNDFFGRSDKSKLPAFTKKVVEPAPTAPVVQDTFAEAMGLLKGKSASSMFPETTPLATNVSGKSGGKPTKRVRFMADNELCQIKVVERLVYEGEEYESHPVGDARKMDAVEGRYLHSSENFLEEEIEWVTPFEVLLTSETISNLETSPLVSAEAAAQEEREKGLSEFTYGDDTPIPDTPNEPIESEPLIGDTQSTALPKMMKLGGDLLLDPQVSHLIAKAQAGNSIDAPLATDHTVSDLLARLGRGGGNALSEVTNQTVVSQNPSAMLNLPPGFDLNFLNSLSQGGSLQALFAASANIAQPPQPADPFPTTIRDNGWGAAAGSASRNRDQRDTSAPCIPTGPSAGVSRNKRRKKGKEGTQPRIPAHDSFGRHIKCKWWPDCPHGTKCFYKHG